MQNDWSVRNFCYFCGMNSILSRIFTFITLAIWAASASAQINTDQVMRVGQNALYFEDYLLSIQYFNRVIEAKPYLAKPYFYRAVAKVNLDDYRGALDDASKAIELNPFLTDAYEVRGVALQNLGRTKEAIADYDTALTQLPDNRQIMFNKALALEDVGMLDSALVAYNEIINAHPGYDNAYVGRGKLYLALKDTVAASADIDKALSINKNLPNAYLIRASIAIDGTRDYEKALADMDEVIKLLPQEAGLFVNRAFLRYNLNDFFGAMSDYDYALALDPTNRMAYFNRGLLRMEVADNDNAIKDFSKVIEMAPDDYRALYNRALLRKDAGAYDLALDDLNKVIDAAPEFSIPVYARFQVYDAMGNMKAAAADYDKAIALAKEESKEYAMEEAEGKDVKNGFAKLMEDKEINEADPAADELVASRFARKFTSLLTADNQLTEEQEFNNKNIRGKVQDRKIHVDIEPDFVASFYTAPTELAPSTYYMQEIDQVNSTRQLRKVMRLTNSAPQLDDEDRIADHFRSIDDVNSYLSTHAPRAIDYFGRAMDYFTLRNYEAAEADLTRAIDVAGDFTLAYFMRGVVKTRLMTASEAGQIASDVAISREEKKARYRGVIDDYEKVLELSPRSPFAYFNLGNIYLDMNDLTSALSAYAKAIELKPDFGEAYYNRGYVYFSLGNKEAGSADLSKAGQLGILPSYNLLKRIAK